MFQPGPGFFRTGSDTSYGGPLLVGQTYAQAGPRIANHTKKTATLDGIALQAWCLWTAPRHCQPTANVRIVNVLYVDRPISLTNDRWPLSAQYKQMMPFLRPISTPLLLPPAARSTRST